MTREINTIRRKDDRDNGILWLLILFLFLFELTIGFLTYLNGPLLVTGKPDTKLAAVGVVIQDVDTANIETNTEVEQAPEELKKAETIVYERPEKQVLQIKAPEVKLDEPVQSVIPPETASTTEVVTASTTTTSNPVPAIDTYTLTYIAGDGGYMAGSTTQTVAYGTNGTEVAALPNANYRFFNWSDDSTINPRTDASVTANKSVTANFVFVYSRSRPSSSVSLSNIATITSGTYTVSAGGTANETITGVPFGTDKATFLSALTKGQPNQSWNDAGINDTITSSNTLVVTAQDGTTVVTYTVTVNDPPPPGGPG